MDTHDLYHALAGLLIVLGRELTEGQARRIRQHGEQLAQDLEAHGETTRSVLTQSLCAALTAHRTQESEKRNG